MINPDDYAILVGINRYPELGPGGIPQDLKGPSNDVSAIKEWLMDEKGGGVPEKNIFTFKSLPAQKAAEARPTADELETVFSTFIRLAESNPKGRLVGRRIYIYMSGHGFSPARQHGCLFVGNATEQMGYNVHATDWLSWLQDSAYFSEFVLLMDCCMERMALLPPRDLSIMKRQVSRFPPRANFIAFAAQRPLKAVEADIPEDSGKVHGLFTWALIEGLKGAAADNNARVTGRSLADWIRNAMVARMGPKDFDDPLVATDPEVIQEDAGLIFVRGVTKPFIPIHINLQGVTPGSEARIWGGSPPCIQKTLTASPTPELVKLQPGLYVIEVPGSNLRQGFEVLKSFELSVVESGPPIHEAPAGSVFELTIDPGDPTAEIFVIDHQFSLADRNTGTLTSPLTYGIYKIKTRVARKSKQRVILLDGNRPEIEAQTVMVPVSTVVPIVGTAASHEYQRAGLLAAVHAANALDTPAHRAVLMIMVRTFSDQQAPVSGTKPWQGVTVVDANDNLVIDLAKEGQLNPNDDSYGFCVKEVEPGCYYLRQQLAGGGQLEQSLIVCKSWRLEAYVLRRVLPGETELSPRPRVSVMMRGLGDGPGSEEEDRLIEVARIALADERQILNTELEDLLMRKASNPMASLIGGHLLLVERERNPARDLSLLVSVVENLQEQIGANHPDVAALALECENAKLGSAVKKLIGPPMFHHSWKHLVKAAQNRRALIPIQMWERVQALTVLPPFLAWSNDDAVKLATRRELLRAIYGDVEAENRQPVPAKKVRNLAKSTLLSIGKSPNEVMSSSSVRKVAQASSVDARARALRLGLPPSALLALKDVVP